jgi:hypothetical protein
MVIMPEPSADSAGRVLRILFHGAKGFVKDSGRFAQRPEPSRQDHLRAPETSFPSPR